MALVRTAKGMARTIRRGLAATTGSDKERLEKLEELRDLFEEMAFGLEMCCETDKEGVGDPARDIEYGQDINLLGDISEELENLIRKEQTDDTPASS